MKNMIELQRIAEDIGVTIENEILFYNNIKDKKNTEISLLISFFWNIIGFILILTLFFCLMVVTRWNSIQEVYVLIVTEQKTVAGTKQCAKVKKNELGNTRIR